MNQRVSSGFEDRGGALQIGLGCLVGEIRLDEPVGMLRHRAQGGLGLKELGAALIEDPEVVLEARSQGRWNGWGNQRRRWRDAAQAHRQIEWIAARASGPR